MQKDREDLLKQISTNTINYRIKQWIDNFKANLSTVAGGYGVHSLTGTLEGVPSILVGSGPTLDRNIQALFGLQNKACIVCCDSALRALLDHKIRPHLVLTTDSKPKVANFFNGIDTSDLTFIVDCFVHPETIAAIKGRIYWYSTLPVDACPFTAALNQWTGFLGNLGTGGCVATTAWFMINWVLKCDPDILVGLPEAFYDPAEMYARVVTRHNETEQYPTPPVADTDIFGGPCYTHPALQSFAFWFQDAFLQKPGIHINCSEGGILKENILNMPLEYCAERYLKTEYDICKLLYVKEQQADEIISQVTTSDLTQYKSMLMVLLDGPSLPNLALRMGRPEQEVHDTVGILREHGLNIDEGKNVMDLPGGVKEEITTYMLLGLLPNIATQIPDSREEQLASVDAPITTLSSFGGIDAVPVADRKEEVVPPIGDIGSSVLPLEPHHQAFEAQNPVGMRIIEFLESRNGSASGKEISEALGIEMTALSEQIVRLMVQDFLTIRSLTTFEERTDDDFQCELQPKSAWRVVRQSGQ